MHPNPATSRRSHLPRLKRTRSKFVLMSVVIVAFIFLNALPWWIRHRLQHSQSTMSVKGPKSDEKDMYITDDVDENGNQEKLPQRGQRVAEELGLTPEEAEGKKKKEGPAEGQDGSDLRASDSDRQEDEQPKASRRGAGVNKKGKNDGHQHGSKKGGRNKKGKGKRSSRDEEEENEAPASIAGNKADVKGGEVEGEWIGEGEATDLLDSLTAQQLLDGGYTYRSYAEIEAEDVVSRQHAEKEKMVAGGEEHPPLPRANGEKRSGGGGKGFARIDEDKVGKGDRSKESKKRGKSSSSRSIATHRFSTAKKYDPTRPDRVCAPLLPNVSLEPLRRETNRIGTFQEYWYTGDIDITPEEALESEEKAAAVMAMRTRRPTADQLRSGRGGNGNDDKEEENGEEPDKPNDQISIPLVEKEPVVKYAYVLMISNHKYVDGALVVAQSLRQHSEMVKSGEADLVLIITEKIKMTSVRLLTRVFTRVKVMYSMSTYAPNSYYKTTFDKIYLFWLTEYKVVLFMDADSLVTGNPDGLILDKEFEGDPEYNAKRLRRGKKIKKTPLTAVGGGDYFQTGLLIAKPDRQLFTDLFLEFRLGAFGYNQWRARDGVLIRTCFMEPHTNIEHPLDRLYHFYGFVKPWFNKDSDYKYGKGDDRLSFNPNYWDWWRRYEELHERYFVTIAAVEQQREEAASSGASTFSKYVYGWSANYPEKDVPIPGLPLKHPYTGEVVSYKKPKGGWSKFDALKVAKTDFPKFFSNVSIFEADRAMVLGNGGRSSTERDSQKPQLVTSLINPRDYMWIQRFSVGAEYFRPTFKKYAEIFNTSVEAVARRFLDEKDNRAKDASSLLEEGSSVPNVASVIIGEPGDSCTETCSKKKGERSGAHQPRIRHGLCVEEALKSTEVNDCFFGYARDFSPENRSVVMPHSGHHCDVCTYEYKSEAAPFIFPTTPEIIEQSSRKETEAERKKRLRKRRKKEKQEAKLKALGAAAGNGEPTTATTSTTRAHKQAVLEEDEDEEAIRRRFTLAEAVKDGKKLNECRVNFLHEKLLVPTCEARREGAARVCVCV